MPLFSRKPALGAARRGVGADEFTRCTCFLAGANEHEGVERSINASIVLPVSSAYTGARPRWPRSCCTRRTRMPAPTARRPHTWPEPPTSSPRSADQLCSAAIGCVLVAVGLTALCAEWVASEVSLSQTIVASRDSLMTFPSVACERSCNSSRPAQNGGPASNTSYQCSCPSPRGSPLLIGSAGSISDTVDSKPPKRHSVAASRKSLFGRRIFPPRPARRCKRIKTEYMDCAGRLPRGR